MNKALTWIVLLVGILLVVGELGVQALLDFSGWLVAIGFLALGLKLVMHHHK